MKEIFWRNFSRIFSEGNFLKDIFWRGVSEGIFFEGKNTCRRHESEKELPEQRNEMHKVVHTGRTFLFSVITPANCHGLDELLLPGIRPYQKGRVRPLHQFIHRILEQEGEPHVTSSIQD